MGQRICKHKEWEDVTHYVLSQFLENPKAVALIERGEAMKFMSGMIHLSFYSKTSPYHKHYRQSGKVVELYPTTGALQEWEPYELERDQLTEELWGILEDMKSESVELWYLAQLMELYIDCGNYSQIERKTGIPRTSVKAGVEHCRRYIKETLIKRDIDYDY